VTGIDDLEHVFSGDPAAEAGAGDLRRADSIFRQQLTDDWGEHEWIGRPICWLR
jgi:hypothetical protein